MARLVDGSADVNSNLVSGAGTSSLAFTMPGNVAMRVQSVVASITNNATAAVRPELTIRDQSGVVIATTVQGATIPSSDTGTATFALRLLGDIRSQIFSASNFFDQTLTGTATSIDTTGTNISGANVLEIWAIARTDRGGVGADNCQFQFNGDSSGIYDDVYVRNIGGTIDSLTLHSQTSIIAQAPGAIGAPAGVFGVIRMTIPFYGGTQFKTLEFTNGWSNVTAATFDRAILGACQYRSTNPITSIQMTTSPANFIAGTRLMILGR